MSNFIDETYFKEFNSVDFSVDDKLIAPSITMAQMKYIKKLLGIYNNTYPFYDELVIQNNNNTLTQPNSFIMDNYIKPALAKYTLYECLVNIGYRIENIGVIKRTAEYAEIADFKEIAMIRQKAKDDAEYFANELNDYLCNNSGSFPKYNISTHSRPFSSSIYFRKK